ncbi:hypothetical protein B0F90DRAFT_1668483 [Multifurca ochricompacta]|uniref:DUF2421 domain-containing protein n=1 Tax=Multifurca ochricompacta TaxID=376703 RepID=A0AAD4QMZ8_9AGAM|nr:hypothetical protein B0F90DRAFT_1668483 [Multifurca ochricompacta]
MSRTQETGTSTDTTTGRLPNFISHILKFVLAVWDFIRPQPWVINNIRKRKSHWLLFRSWLAGWIMLFLMLPTNSLKTIGNLAYFGLLFSTFIPPMFPVQIYFVPFLNPDRPSIVVRSTDWLDMWLSWNEGSHFYFSGQTSSNPDQAFRIEIFRGDYLDARASAMYGLFMGIGALIFGFVRAYSVSLKYFSIFGIIALDIYCCIGPLYPFANYAAINGVLIASSGYCAIALVCCFVFSPETVNQAYLGLVSTILGKVKAMLSSQDELLSPKSGDFGPGCPKLKALTEARFTLLTMYQNLTGFAIYLQSEFSVGRWSGDDVHGLADPLLAVVARISGLSTFVKHLRDLPSPPEAFAFTPAPATVSSDTNLLHHVFNPDITRESILKVTLIEALPHVREATAELRAATIQGVVATQALVDAVSNDRLLSRSGPIAPLEERLDIATNKLRAALDNFKEQGTDAVLLAYGHKPRVDIPLRSLYIGYVFSSTAIIIGEVVLSLVQTVAETSARRRRVRPWAPSSLRHFVHALLKGRRKNEECNSCDEGNETYEDEEDIQEQKYQLDPDSHPPGNSFQRFMNRLHYVLIWSRTPKALDAEYDDCKFIFRYVLVSILLWLPYFFYVNKGLCRLRALIMGQATMSVYAGDQVYQYVIRITGTFLGLITTLLIWYTGNGSGNGTPYGLAVSYAVFFVPIMFVRLFAPVKYAQGISLGCYTASLITGFSWIDGHLPVLSNPGIGWPAAWRRWATAVIGCGASFVIMMLPPLSGRKAVRLRAAASLNALSHVYTSLISAWITDGAEGEDVTFTSTSREKAFRERLIAVTLQVQAVKQQMMLATWEGGIRGRWPQKKEMIGVLAQLGGALWKLDTKWRLSLLDHTKVVDPNFIADIVSVFSSVSQSLRTGESMHTVLPQTLLDRLLLHHQAGWAVAPTPNLDRHNVIGPEEMQSLNHMFYTSRLSPFTS